VAVESLQKLPTLAVLYLAHHHIDDDATPMLEGLTTLKALDLFNTDVTSRAERELRLHLPGCNVRFVYWASGDKLQR
jgi:hypothetical protein